MTDDQLIAQLRSALVESEHDRVQADAALAELAALRERELADHNLVKVQLVRRETDLRDMAERLDKLEAWAKLQRHVLTTISTHRDTDRIGEVHVYETDGRATIPLLEAIAEVAKQEPRRCS